MLFWRFMRRVTFWLHFSRRVSLGAKKSMFSKLKAFARRARRLEAIPIIIIKNEAVSVPTSRMFCPANVQLHLDDYKTIWIWQEHDKDQSFPPINPTFNQSRLHECSPSAEEAGAKPRPSTQSKCSSERMSSWPVPRLLLWTLLGGWKTWIILKFFWSFDESFCCFVFGAVADGMLPTNPYHSVQLTNLSQSPAHKSLPWPVDLGAQKRRAHWKHIAQTMSWTSLNPQSSDPTPPTSKATMSTKMDEVHRLWRAKLKKHKQDMTRFGAQRRLFLDSIIAHHSSFIHCFHG